MATRRRIFDYGYFNSNHKLNDGLFSLTTTVEDGELKLSVIKLHTHNYEHVEFNKEPITAYQTEQLQLTKELFDLIVNQHGEDMVAASMDAFMRWKFRDSIVYKLLYYAESTNYRSGTSYVKDLLWVLYDTDVDVLEYLVYLFGGEELKMDLFLSACLKAPVGKNGCSPRHRLGFSKNKARVIKACRFPEVMSLPNYVFDDDIDFLLEFFEIRHTYALLSILQIKEANPKLKYEDIIRRATIFTIDAQNEWISFSSAIDSFKELLKCYNIFKANGFDCPFKLCKSSLIGVNYSAEGEANAKFIVEGARSYRITKSEELVYANAISEAFSKDALIQVLARGNDFYLIVKKGRYYIAEVHDGYIININSKYDASSLQIVY